MFRNYLVLIVMFSGFSFQQCTGQETYDSTFIRKQTDRPLWGIQQSVYKNNLQIRSGKKNDPNAANIDYVSESLQKYGISYSRNNFNLTLNFIGVEPPDTRSKGKSNYFNLGVSSIRNQYLFEGSLRRFKGFYDNNTFIFRTHDTTGVFYQKPGLAVVNIQVSCWKFRKSRKFSYNAAYRGTEQQRRSTATFISFIKMNYGNINSNGLLLAPYSKFPENPDYNTWSGSNSGGIIGGIGGAATIVISKHFFANWSLIGALGFSVSEYRFSNRNLILAQPEFGGSFRFSIGYSGDRWMIRSSSVADYFSIGNKTIEIYNQFLINTFTIAYRFNKSGPLLGIQMLD